MEKERTDWDIPIPGAPTHPEETRVFEKDVVLPVNLTGRTSLHSFCRDYINGLVQTLYTMPTEGVENLVRDLLRARDFKKNIFVMGNGGSAANASHLAADLAKDRYGDRSYLFRVQSLVDNSPMITAEGNDTGYENIFVAQLRRMMDPRDVVIAISSSGNSENVLKAVDFANENGALTHSLVGFGGGQLASVCSNSIEIPTEKGQYGFHEDACSVIIHMIIDYLVAHDTGKL